MPHTVQIATKKIVVKSGIQIILQSYEQAIGSLSPEQKQILGVSSEEHARDGILAMVQSKAESVSGTRNGAKERCLSAIECNLSEFAFELREAYIGFLNALIQQVKKTAQDAEAEEIESRYVLVRELLLRLLTVGLSDEENNKRAGDGFIVAMKTFVESILGKENLELHDKFRYTLCYQHPEWLQSIGQAVEIIKLIHLPQSTFTALVNYLDQIKRATKIHILFGCGVSVSASDISEQWINTSYQTFLLGQKPKSEAIIPASDTEVTRSLVLTASQKQKLENIKHRPVATHLGELFLLLNQTELLSKMVAKIDNLIKASAWVLLLTGKLRFEPLIHYLKTHQERCENLLDVGKLGLRENSSACRTLITCNLLSAKGITAVVSDICRKIQQLGSLGNHTLMMKQFACDLNELLAYEELLGIKLLGDASMPLTLAHAPETAVRQVDYPEGYENNIVMPTQIDKLNDVVIEEYYGRHNIKKDLISTQSKKSPLALKETQPIGISPSPNEEPIMEEVVEKKVVVENQTNDVEAASLNQTLLDAKFFNEVSPDPEIQDNHFRDAIPPYIKVFFQDYQDVEYEKTILFLQQKSLFRKQKKMGEKGLDRSEASMDEMASREADLNKNFFCLFNQESTFEYAGDFCKEVKAIIRRFEKNQMETKKPTGHIDTFFDLHIVWEKRNYEILALKYLCVIVAQSDERILKEFIEKFVSENDWKLQSSYSVLKNELEILLKKCANGDIKLRRFMYLAHQNLQITKIVEYEKRITNYQHALQEKDKLIVAHDRKIQNLEARDNLQDRKLEEVLKRLSQLEAERNNGNNPNNAPVGNEERSCFIM